MTNYEFSSRRDISPQAINALRWSVSWETDAPEIWKEQLDKSLAVASSWVDGGLVGIGFLIGTVRHANIVDVCVKPSDQGNGVGSHIVKSLVDFAHDNDIRYTRLNFVAEHPWLEQFYNTFGFEPEDNAMILPRS